jgi:anaerobic magnesium-protoporphyrin IX monomethyl ester cyclase
MTEMSGVELQQNLGARPIKPLRSAIFPDAGRAVRSLEQRRPDTAVDVLLVNPPSPDGAIWIRTQHRVGRRSREEMVWPQCSLAQLAAMLHPDYSVAVVDAIAERMTWKEFEEALRKRMPKYYLTQVTAPTLTNDMHGVMLAKSLGAKTLAFGTHVTPMPFETMRDYPALDFILRGEPELTLRELLDVMEGRHDRLSFQEGRPHVVARAQTRRGRAKPASGSLRPKGIGVAQGRGDSRQRRAALHR